ncbi:MAG: hypothetical protein NVSMB5_20320 [Candidatus Velthaea sp.]
MRGARLMPISDAGVMHDVAAGNLDFLFTKHPRPIWVADAETLRFLAVNDAAIALYGFERELFLTLGVADIGHDDAFGQLTGSGPFVHRDHTGRAFSARIESTFVEYQGRAAHLVMIVDLTDQLTTQRALHERESQLRLFVDYVPAIMWTTDTNLYLTSVAGAALAPAGLRTDDGVGAHIGELFAGEGLRRPSSVPPSHIAALLGNRVRIEGWWRDRYFDSVIEPRFDEQRQIVGTIGVALDITDRHKDRRALERRTEELHAAQAIAHFGSWSMNLHTGSINWSPELFRILGEQPGDTDVESTLFQYDHPDDVDLVRNAIATAERLRQPYDIEHRIVSRNGSTRIVREQGAFDFDSFGQAVRCVGTVLDITDRKTAEDRLAYLAHHDPLTHLANRTLLQERLNRAVARAERHNANAAVLFLDLDRFKYINDTFGHVVGDELLVGVSRRISAALRAGDTVARAGGDEFVIVLEDLDNAESASDLALRIRREFARPFDLSIGAQFIAASIGIALYPFDGVTPNDLLRSADSAMYRAKERGGNDFQFFTPQLHEAAMRQLELGNALRVAVEQRDVYVVYQPINRTSDYRTVSVEALARWNRGGAQPVGPADFIRIAEDIGIIGQLGELVLRQACSQMAAWLRAGVPIESIAVNISSRQLSDRGFVSGVAQILLDTQLAPQRLELEITETAFVSGNDESFAAITQLRELGVRFAIDDFGTGYSSLAYLKRIPADTVKIDRSFISDIDAPADRAIIEAVIMVARHLGKRVVAEGVETADQLALLKRLDCECVQGYYFSEPVEAARIEDLFEAASAI